LKITQVVEASLQVSWLAPSMNLENTYYSLDICDSEKYNIKNDMSIKPKRRKDKKRMYTTIHMLQEVTQGDPHTSNTY
jgi:hypothetical protein